MTLPKAVHARLVDAGEALAAEVAARRPDRRAWVWVGYHRRDDTRDSVSFDPAWTGRFEVRYVEVDTALLADYLEHDYDWHGSEFSYWERFIVERESAAAHHLSRWLDELRRLTSLEEAQYPPL